MAVNVSYIDSSISNTTSPCGSNAHIYVYINFIRLTAGIFMVNVDNKCDNRQ